MNILKIEKQEYISKKNTSINFSVGEPKVYGKIANINLGWSSDLINPDVLYENEIVVVGIDQRLLIYNLALESIEVLLPLNSFYMGTKLLSTQIAAYSETELIILNKTDYSISEYLTFPDIIESCVFTEKKIHISLQDKSNHVISLYQSP